MSLTPLFHLREKVASSQMHYLFLHFSNFSEQCTFELAALWVTTLVCIFSFIFLSFFSVCFSFFKIFFLSFIVLEFEYDILGVGYFLLYLFCIYYLSFVRFWFGACR